MFFGLQIVKHCATAKGADRMSLFVGIFLRAGQNPQYPVLVQKLFFLLF